MAHFRESLGSNFNGMTKNKAKSLVYNDQERSFGGDGISKMEQLFFGSDDRAFLWEHRLFVDKDGMQRMMCFSLPVLLALLKYPKVRLYYYFNHCFISTYNDNLCPLPSQGSNFCWLYLWHCPPSILSTLHCYGLWYGSSDLYPLCLGINDREDYRVLLASVQLAHLCCSGYGPRICWSWFWESILHQCLDPLWENQTPWMSFSFQTSS